MRTKIFYLIVVLFFLSSCSVQDVNDKVAIQRIRNDTGKHQAFTDLAFFEGQFFLSFRESDKHVDGRAGIIKLMSSKDGEKWTLIKEFTTPGIDLRDPKFSVNGNDLFLYIHGSTYENRELVALSDYRVRYSSKWNLVEDVILDNNQVTKFKIQGNESWPWRVTWYKNIAYTFGYNGLDIFGLYKSEDGLYFKNERLYSNVAIPTESTIRVSEKGQFFVLSRRDYGSALFQKYNSDTNELSLVVELPFINFGGPNFLFLDENRVLFAGSNGNVRVGTYNLKTNQLKIPFNFGGGDGGYPGMVIKDDVLWVSFYSSEQTKDGSSIYIAKIKLKDLL